MSRISKTALMRYFEIVEKGPDGWKYRCRICGEVVMRDMRIRHLYFKHPTTYIRLEQGDE